MLTSLRLLTVCTKQFSSLHGNAPKQYQKTTRGRHISEQELNVFFLKNTRGLIHETWAEQMLCKSFVKPCHNLPKNGFYNNWNKLAMHYRIVLNIGYLSLHVNSMLQFTSELVYDQLTQKYVLFMFQPWDPRVLKNIINLKMYRTKGQGQ